jgi:hypothetical protein
VVLADHAIPKTTSTTFHQNTSLAKKPTYSTGLTDKWRSAKHRKATPISARASMHQIAIRFRGIRLRAARTRMGVI